jgi:hypothetical protein
MKNCFKNANFVTVVSIITHIYLKYSIFDAYIFRINSPEAKKSKQEVGKVSLFVI